MSRSDHPAGRPRPRQPARPPLRVVDGAPTRRQQPVPRPFPVTVLYGAVSTLLALGLVMVLSAGSVTSLEFYGWSYHYFAWQAPAAVIGMVMALGIARVDYRSWRRLSALGMVVILTALVLVLVPGLGQGAYGARRWIGPGVMKVQPAEFAKPVLTVACAHVVALRVAAGAPTGAVMGPPLMLLAITGALVMMEPDLGTTIAIAVIVFAVIFVAGAALRSMAALVMAGAGGALVLGMTAGYRRSRLLSFLDPWADPLSAGYQSVQSLLALGGGGWTGVGLGASRQKWLFLPNAHTDFIFAIVGEELGLVGTLIVVLLFGAIAWAGVRIALAAPDLFGTLVAAGVTTWLVGQGLINMGTVTGLLPITGIPLPFVSFGLSQLTASLAGVGLLAAIGRAGAVPRAGAGRRAGTASRAAPVRR